MPPNLPLADLAGVPLVGLTSLQAFRKLEGGLGAQTGKKILIHAGAGGLGSVAIQLARHYLRMEVATTCGPNNVDFVRKLGAHHPINYHQDKFEEVLSNYDVVFDSIEGSYEARALKGHVLQKGGHYLSILTGKDGLLGLAWTPTTRKLRQWIGRGPRWSRVMVRPSGTDMQLLAQLLETGIIKPVVDRIFPLTEASDAHRYLEQGHARGKVILDCRPNTP